MFSQILYLPIHLCSLPMSRGWLTVLGEFSCYAAIQKFSLDGQNNVFWLQHLNILVATSEFGRAIYLEKDVFPFLSLFVKNTEYLYL